MPKNSKPAETETAIIVAIVRRIPEVNAERNSARISRTGKYECQRQQSKKRSQFPSEPSGAAQAGADDAYSFVVHMRLSYQNKPHWQMARQALNNVCASNVSEIHAWRTFRAAAAAEGWLVE